MNTPTLLKIDTLNLHEIEVGSRLRPVSHAAVESLVASINELGVMKDAVHVRKRKDGRFVLIAGAHRLAAATELGWFTIQAKVWTDVTDDWAQLMEVDDNIAGAELSPLDTAVFLAQRKAIYQRLHPETKRGVAGALARWDDATANVAVASFVKTTAEKFCMSERKVFMLLAAGANLNPGDSQKLREAPQQVSLKDLGELAKLAWSAERSAVIDALVGGTAKSAAEARRAWKARETGFQTPVKDPVEEAFTALLKLWSRAPEAAKRRFVREMEPQLSMRIRLVRDAVVINEKLGLDASDPKGSAMLDARANRLRGGTE